MMKPNATDLVYFLSVPVLCGLLIFILTPDMAAAEGFWRVVDFLTQSLTFRRRFAGLAALSYPIFVGYTCWRIASDHTLYAAIAAVIAGVSAFIFFAVVISAPMVAVSPKVAWVAVSAQAGLWMAVVMRDAEERWWGYAGTFLILLGLGAWSVFGVHA